MSCLDSADLRLSSNMKTSVALLVLFLTVHTEGNTSGHSWTYPEEQSRNGNSWSKDFPTCAGEKQSPINIQTKELVVNPFLEPLVLSGYGYQDGEFQLINNGHSAQLSLPPTMRIRRGLDFTYRAKQLHFHWGGKPEESGGSEHTINGVRFSSELHIVHYNSDLYSSFEEAANKPHGIAVIAVLLEAKKGEWNSYFEDLFSHLTEIQTVGSNVTLNNIDVLQLLPYDSSKFMRYEGSLTTPPCTENVSWIVLKNTVTISTEQLEKLQNSLMNNNNQIIKNNFRNVKPLNKRIVKANFLPKKGKHSRREFLRWLPPWLGMF